MNDPTPSKNFTLKPDGKVNTTWAVIGSIIAATGILVGGLVSVKNDIATAAEKAATAASDANQALGVARDIKEELQRMRWQLGLESHTGSITKPPRNVP